MRTRTADSDGGFSLIEILVVIVVLGILTATTVFAIRGINNRGEESSCGADARVIQTAAAVYMAEYNVDSVPATAPLDGDEFERTLVVADLLKSTSSYYDMDENGAVTSNGDPCT